MVDTCTGTLAATKACSQLPEHRRLLGSLKYSVCFQDDLPSQVEVYQKQALCLDTDVAGSVKAVEKSEVFVKEMAAPSQGEKLKAGLCRPELFLCRVLLRIECIF